MSLLHICECHPADTDTDRCGSSCAAFCGSPVGLLPATAAGRHGGVPLGPDVCVVCLQLAGFDLNVVQA